MFKFWHQSQRNEQKPQMDLTVPQLGGPYLGGLPGSADCETHLGRGPHLSRESNRE